MAKIRDSEISLSKINQDSLVANQPEHVTDDLLLYIVTKDDAVGGAHNTPSGLTKGGETGLGSGANSVRSAWYYKIATSSSEPPPTFTNPDADTWSVVALSIQGVNTASPIDTSNGDGITDVTGNPYTAASVTTGFANSLILYAIASDGGVAQVAAPGFITAETVDSGGDATAVAYTVQRTAGATPTCDFFAEGQADDSILFTIAIRDGSSGAILPGYPNSDCATVVRPLRGTALTYSGDSIDTNSNNFTQLAGTWANPTYVFQADDSGGPSFVDLTTAATNATDADVSPFPAVEATGDYIAIGYSSAFIALRIDMAGCTAGVAGVLASEYLATGGTWKTLPEFFTPSGNLTAAVADHFIHGWSMPSDWTAQTLNGQSQFWIRWRITTIYTTNPTISQIFVSTSLAMHHHTITSRVDAGFTPWVNSCNLSTVANRSGNLMTGGCYVLGSVENLSTARLMGTYLWDSPADTLDLGKRVDGGVAIGLIDSTDKVKAWCVGASDSKDTYANKRNNFLIQVDQSTDTALLSNSPTMSDVKRILLMTNNKFNNVQVSFNPLLNVGTLKISGGGSTTPVTFDELVAVANGYPCPLIDSITNVAYVPIQIGGVDAVNCQMSGFTLSWPQQATAANRKTEFHSDTGIVGVIFDGRAGDVISIDSARFTSLSPVKFEFLATASASCTWTFRNCVVNNANVTLRAVTTFSTFTFSSCPSFTQNSAVITDTAFSDTKVSSASPADAALITNSSFTSSGTGHAIEIGGTAATISLDGLTFTGYAGSNGSTGNEAIYVNIAAGSMTINIIGGGSTPSIRTAGCTVTVQNAVTVTVTVLDVNTGTPIQNARVLVEKVSDGTDILAGLTNASGVITASYAFAGDTAVTGKVRRASSGYGTLYKSSPVSGTITSAGLSATILLIPDE